MNDYLQALVERARGEARTVRPLLAPRFAPTPQTEDLELDVEVPAAAPRAAAEAPPARASGAADAAGPQPADAPPPAPRRRAVADPEPSLESRRGVPADSREPADDDELPHAPQPSTVLQVAETTHVVERHVVEETTRRASEASAPVEATVERVLAPEAREPAAPERPAASSAPAEAALPVGVLEEPGGDDAAETEAQTVVVSIGRIEVSADRPGAPPAPAPAPARSWAGPRLSLDDYLRERSGGRR